MPIASSLLDKITDPRYGDIFYSQKGRLFEKNVVITLMLLKNAQLFFDCVSWVISWKNGHNRKKTKTADMETPHTRKKLGISLEMIFFST